MGDEVVEFALPGAEERERLVRLYFDKYVLSAAMEGSRGRRLKIEDMDFSELCSEIAELGVAWQAGGYASEDGIVTKEMILGKVEGSRKQHTQKMSWLSEEENRENRQTAYRVPGSAPITNAVHDLGFTAKSFHSGWTR